MRIVTYNIRGGLGTDRVRSIRRIADVLRSVDAEVIFPSQRTMSAFMAQEDDAYHLAGLNAYNTWLNTEFTAADHTRFVSLAQMPAVDIATAVSWLREAKTGGFKGVIISAYPSGNATLSLDDDPFWEAAEQEQMPIHLHVGLSQAGKRRSAGSRLCVPWMVLPSTRTWMARSPSSSSCT